MTRLFRNCKRSVSLIRIFDQDLVVFLADLFEKIRSVRQIQRTFRIEGFAIRAEDKGRRDGNVLRAAALSGRTVPRAQGRPRPSLAAVGVARDHRSLVSRPIAA